MHPAGPAVAGWRPLVHAPSPSASSASPLPPRPPASPRPAGARALAVGIRLAAPTKAPSVAEAGWCTRPRRRHPPRPPAQSGQAWTPRVRSEPFLRCPISRALPDLSSGVRSHVRCPVSGPALGLAPRYPISPSAPDLASGTRSRPPVSTLAFGTRSHLRFPISPSAPDLAFGTRSHLRLPISPSAARFGAYGESQYLARDSGHGRCGGRAGAPCWWRRCCRDGLLGPVRGVATVRLAVLPEGRSGPVGPARAGVGGSRLSPSAPDLTSGSQSRLRRRDSAPKVRVST